MFDSNPQLSLAKKLQLPPFLLLPGLAKVEEESLISFTHPFSIRLYSVIELASGRPHVQAAEIWESDIESRTGSAQGLVP
jgi:hypothetical protein